MADFISDSLGNAKNFNRRFTLDLSGARPRHWKSEVLSMVPVELGRTRWALPREASTQPALLRKCDSCHSLQNSRRAVEPIGPASIVLQSYPEQGAEGPRSSAFFVLRAINREDFPTSHTVKVRGLLLPRETRRRVSTLA